MPSSPPRNACATPVPGGRHDDRAGAHGVLLDAVLLPQQQVAVALEDDEDLLLGRVAVRRRVQLPGKDLGVADARSARARLAPGVRARGGRPSRRRARRPRDRRRGRWSTARRELRHLGRAGRRLARPRMILLGADRRPGLPEPRDARARQPRDAGRVRALPEREHVEPVGPGLERVRVLEREVHEAVARAAPRSRRESPSPSHCTETPEPAEDVEDLLLGALEVERRRPHARDRPGSA